MLYTDPRGTYLCFLSSGWSTLPTEQSISVRRVATHVNGGDGGGRVRASVCGGRDGKGIDRRRGGLAQWMSPACALDDSLILGPRCLGPKDLPWCVRKCLPPSSASTMSHNATAAPHGRPKQHPNRVQQCWKTAPPIGRLSGRQKGGFLECFTMRSDFRLQSPCRLGNQRHKNEQLPSRSPPNWQREKPFTLIFLRRQPVGCSLPP